MDNPYQFLRDLQAEIAQLPRPLTEMQVPAGTLLFDESAPCAGFPLVLDGEVKVSRSSADGRLLELYRVGPGEICLVSAACLFSGLPMSARGVASRAVRLALIPPELFDRWLARPAFRSAVLGLFADRMADLTALVDAIAFQRLDQRLARTLLEQPSPWLVTHQAIAERLGTVREIITRLLRRFENDGWVELSRERIDVRDADALRRLAGDAR